MKKIVKSILNNKTVSKKLISYYGYDQSIKKCYIARAVADGGNWFFSQMKSGTTLFCNCLAFYNAGRLQIDDVNFDCIHKAGVFRGFSSASLMSLVSYVRDFRLDPLVQTHSDLPNAHPRVLITIDRDPFDYLVSSYFFHFKYRIHRRHVTVDEALPYITKRYVLTRRAQREAEERADIVIPLTYEGLVADTYGKMADVIRVIYGEVYEEFLSNAIADSSSRRLNEFEKKKKEALVASKHEFTQPHFVRSGRIGEGEEFFNNHQKKLIKRLLQSL